MNIKKVVAAALIVSSMTAVSASAAEFNDIKGHWAEDVINELADKDIIHGVSDTEFNPDGTVTRAEFLKMAMDSFGIVGHAYRTLAVIIVVVLLREFHAQHRHCVSGVGQRLCLERVNDLLRLLRVAECADAVVAVTVGVENNVAVITLIDLAERKQRPRLLFVLCGLVNLLFEREHFVCDRQLIRTALHPAVQGSKGAFLFCNSK